MNDSVRGVQETGELPEGFLSLGSFESPIVRETDLEPTPIDLLTQIHKQYTIALEFVYCKEFKDMVFSPKEKWCRCEFQHSYQRQIHNLCHMTTRSICRNS